MLSSWSLEHFFKFRGSYRKSSIEKKNFVESCSQIMQVIAVAKMRSMSTCIPIHYTVYSIQYTLYSTQLSTYVDSRHHRVILPVPEKPLQENIIKKKKYCTTHTGNIWESPVFLSSLGTILEVTGTYSTAASH